MKFTVNWLKQYIDFTLSPAELADRLTMLGLEVDAVEALGAALDHVKVAKIIEVHKHPNADKLVICDVLVGEELTRVVCGAPNARAGLMTAIALPGAVLPGGLTVKAAKIRGEFSAGMLCSERELGISENQAGIMELSESCQCGQLLAEALALCDTLIEVDLTPNRPDCSSVIGIAREVAGVTGGTIKKPLTGALPVLTGEAPFTVEVLAPDACPRYAARLLRNVTIAPSPWWLKRILLAVGLRPINNIVDITNFVMLEYGQPLHAFDFDLIAGGKIVVRKALAQEKMTTLDGTERELDTETLLICDGEKPIAVAGVMGGENTEVSASTVNVLLESAYFEPLSIRRTSRLLNLGTDASYRFERGVDPQGTVHALERAVQLMVEIAGAQVVDNGCDNFTVLAGPAPIALRVGRTNELLGTALSGEEIVNFLAGIEITAEQLDAETLRVTSPSFRVDLEREIDLIEEIARLKGYNNIPSTLPVVPMSFSEEDAERVLRKRLSGILLALGLSEAVNYSFAAEKHCELMGLAADDPLRNNVKILNPLTEEQAVMRTMLLPGLLENVKHNINRQNTDLGLFEIGKVFWPEAGREQPHELMRLAAVISGRRTPAASVLHYGNYATDIFDVKGLAENILRELRFPEVVFKANQAPAFADQELYLDILVREQLVGSIGRLQPHVLKAFGVKQEAYFLDMNVQVLAQLEPAARLFQPLSRFPSIVWDLAFVVPEQTGAGEMVAAILRSGFDYVWHAEIFDVYRGKPIPAGYKSVALSITYHSDEQTLDDDSVGKVHKKVIDLVVGQFDGQLREV